MEQMMFVKKICIFIAAAAIPAAFSAQTAPSAAESASSASPVIVYNEDFVKGEELFSLNKPEEAIEILESALKADGVDPSVYVYLGVAYYQTGEYQKSLDICVVGLAKEGSNRTVLAFNAGNSAYAMGNYARADACYAIALKNDENYTPAYLNRANAQLKQDHLEDARANYETFVERAPNDPQVPQIQRLIELLDEEIERRAREKPELILPEDLNIENAGMDAPEPEFVEESEAPSLPVEPKKDSGELTDAESISPFTEPKQVPYGEELLSGDELTAPEIPEEQLVQEDELPHEVVQNEELPSLESDPAVVTDTETGEVVQLPVLPAPQLKDAADSENEEAVDAEEDELPPADYWDEEAR
ncbi:MAG: tetratricopeptide repeat protein [Treponema sp.]|nr:tetratricopeptide repeat protein [Treponema sp.]